MDYDFKVPEVLLPRDQGTDAPTTAPVAPEISPEAERELLAAATNKAVKPVLALTESDQDRELKIHAAWHKGFIKSKPIINELLSDLSEGKNIYPIFLKAIEALGLLMDEGELLDNVKKEVTAIYGEVLQEPTLLKDELNDVLLKIDRAYEAIDRDTLPDGRISRIKRTLRKLEARRNYLEDTLNLPHSEPVHIAMKRAELMQEMKSYERFLNEDKRGEKRVLEDMQTKGYSMNVEQPGLSRENKLAIYDLIRHRGNIAKYEGCIERIEAKLEELEKA